jgi:hypothetical protein
VKGGVVSQYLSWKWVFWIFGIIAALATTAGFFVIPLPPPQVEPSMRNTVDWIGGTLITVGLIMLLFALSEGNVVGWTTPWVPTLIVVSLLIVLAFGFWQHYLETKTQKRPLMKMSIFKNRKFMWANVLMALFFSSFNNFLVRLSSYELHMNHTLTLHLYLSGLCDVLVSGLPRSLGHPDNAAIHPHRRHWLLCRIHHWPPSIVCSWRLYPDLQHDMCQYIIFAFRYTNTWKYVLLGLWVSGDGLECLWCGHHIPRPHSFRG